MMKTCPTCKSNRIRRFTVYEFGFEHPNNTLCMNCHKRWIDIDDEKRDDSK